MNKQFRELAEQAKEYARSHVADCRRFGYYMEYNEYELRFEKKFAELIVRQCALTAGLMEHDGRKNIGAQILDNFGIQE
jgi:hypothetical protein